MRFVLALLAVLGATPALAVLPHEMLADPAQEARARAISQELRCLVCQNQPIDDSNAPLAADLRRLVRERITAGDSDDAVLRYVTQRYGDYVLLKPPVREDTFVLWYGPFAILALALAGAAVYVRRRRPDAAAAPAPLSEDEEARLAALVGEKDRP
ncbi:MAG: cytochrome c-type biogenesis protein CcmH [Rhodospirillales bacterium]|nr:cytochrome c-type biogenesis protein CcmH [Rhodospirillales bacterium]